MLADAGSQLITFILKKKSTVEFYLEKNLQWQ